MYTILGFTIHRKIVYFSFSLSIDQSTLIVPADGPSTLQAIIHDLSPTHDAEHMPSKHRYIRIHSSETDIQFVNRNDGVLLRETTV